MFPCKIIACCFLMILCPVGMMDWGNRVVALEGPGDDRAADEPGPEPTAGNGEAEDDRAADESGESASADDRAADERGIQPKKGKKSKGKKGTKGRKGRAGLSDDLRDAKFKQLEQFHHNWFNLPPNRVKKSLESAIKFCKVACTKEQCSDTIVSNNCHLMCPISTLKNCPDLNPKTESPPETVPPPPQNEQAQTQLNQNIPQKPPVVTVNGAPQEQVQIPVQQAPIPSEANVILPADQTPTDQTPADQSPTDQGGG